MAKKKTIINVVKIWFRDGSNKAYEFCHAEVIYPFIAIISDGDKLFDADEYDDLYIPIDEVERFKVLHRHAISGAIINKVEKY